MLLNNSVAFKIGDEVRSRRTRNHKSIEGKVTDFKKEKVLVQYGHRNNEKWFDVSELELVAPPVVSDAASDSTKSSGGKVEDSEWTVFSNQELDAAIAQMEDECSHSLTCAVELESDSPLPDCNSDINSEPCVKETNIAETFSQRDTPAPTYSLTCEEMQYTVTTTLSVPHLPANPSQCKETDSVLLMSETASPQLSEQSQIFNPTSLQLKTCQDCSTAPGDQDTDEGLTSTIFSVTFPRAGMMRNGSWSVQDTLLRPGLEKDYFWLESPSALSSSGKTRPPGLSRLEGQLKKIAALAPGEVLNPEFLEQSFSLGIGWTDPQDGRSALEFLQKMAQSAIAEPPSATPSIPLSQPLPFAESSTSTLLLSDQAQNPPELKAKGRAISFGWTSTQLLAGLKNCTRRTWKDSYAKYFIKAFNEGRTIPALNKDYRYGGKVIGHLRLTCCPYKEKLSDMPEADLQAEGGICTTVDQFIKKYFKSDENSVWVIRFEFQPLDRSPSFSQHDDQHRATQPQNPPEPKQPRASGWLEPYIKNKKLKSGITASYPRVEGDRNPNDPHHWYWAYKYEEKSENAVSNNGCITRAVSLPADKVLGVRNAIANKWPVQKILQFIKGEINS